MIDLKEGLLKGQSVYPAAFVRAKKFWDEFFVAHASDDVETLQKAIEDAQTSFQWAVEEVGLIAPMAKDIMAVTCIDSL